MIAEPEDVASQHEAYKRSCKDWTYDHMEAAIEKTDEFVEEIWTSWNQWPGEKFEWLPMPINPIKRVWTDWARHRFTRFPKLVEKIERSMFTNFCKLQACNQMLGHEQHLPECMEELDDEDALQPFYEWLCDIDGITDIPCSDYGLQPLGYWIGCSMRTTVDQKVPYLDRFLNTVHRRGDLCAFFIEGGWDSFEQLHEL